MTKSNYLKYQAAVQRGLSGLEFVSTGACCKCEECGPFDEDNEHARELADEPHFSWSACDCCGSTLGGNRHPAHGWAKQVERDVEIWVRGERHQVHMPAGPDLLVHMDVCEDCLYFINYGQLDDMTMAEMDE